MLRHFHLTKLQWQGILKWSLYALVLLALLLLQTVVLATRPVFGAKLCLVPIAVCCVCIREGPEKGGLFALLASLIWCLSGEDYGNLILAVLPIGSILAAVLCRAVLTDRFFPTALCCLVVSLLTASAVFAFKLILPPGASAANGWQAKTVTVSLDNYWRVLLPGVLISMLSFPPLYGLVKLISRIGVHDAL